MTGFLGTGKKSLVGKVDCSACSTSPGLTGAVGSLVPSTPWVVVVFFFFLLVGHCCPERGLLCRSSNPHDLISWHLRTPFCFFRRGPFWFVQLDRKMAAQAFFLCRPLIPWAACALSLHVRGWRNVLASPLPSCHELPGRMRPIVGCAQPSA